VRTVEEQVHLAEKAARLEGSEGLLLPPLAGGEADGAGFEEEDSLGRAALAEEGIARLEAHEGETVGKGLPLLSRKSDKERGLVQIPSLHYNLRPADA
jgi:hypothetical protein